MLLNSQEHSGQKLTQRAEIAIVRRFREYPDRFVGNPPANGRAEKSPRNPCSNACFKAGGGILRYTGYKRFTAVHFRSSIFPDQNVLSLRPIAIAPATPSTLEGLCGPGQRNGVGSSFELGKTLDHRRLFTSGLLYRFTDATAGNIFGHEALQRPHSFCVYDKKSRDLSVCLAKVWL